MIALPEWLRPDTRPAGPVRRGPAGNRLVRSALGAMGRALALLVPGAGPARGGPLDHADPRAKLVAAIGLIVVTTLLRGPAPIAACLALALVSAALARVPGRRLLPVAVVASVSALLMLPATLNIVSGGHPLVILMHPAAGGLRWWQPPAIVAVTGDGLLVAGRLVLRTTACAALAVLLTATTRPQEFFGGLRSLGVPQAFVMVLAMTERYLGVLLQSARELHLARLARSVAAVGTRREEAWAAAGVGAVFRRTRLLAEQVTLAMVSRGFSGEVRLLRPTHWRSRDWMLVVLAGVVAVTLLALDRWPV